MRTKRLAICCVSVVIICASMIMSADNAHANAVDKLTIKVGYYGWQTSDYVEKAVFPASELYDMGTVTNDYTYWDGSMRVAIDSSYGVPLTRILDAAGIDQSSIAQMDFWTADSGEGAFTSFTWQQLLGTKRYFFDDLAACFEYEDESETNIVINHKRAWKKAYQVQPMMALEEQWVWYEVGTADAKGTDALTTANRFRLNFGQASPDEKRTFNSAKMVHTIYIMFSGVPKLTSKETKIKGKVGSTHQMKVSAAAADEALEQVIEGSLTWSSSNPSIASVDENGLVTFNKKGNVVITATGTGATLQFSVAVGEKNKKEKKQEQKKEKTQPEKKRTEVKKESEKKAEETEKRNGGSGTGRSASGGGNGTGGTSARVSGQGSRSRDNGTNTVTRPKSITLRKSSGRSFMLSDEASQRLRLALKRQAPKEEASMSTHQEEMDEDTKQLKIKKDKDKTDMQTGIACGILALCGMIYGPVGFKIQMGGKKWKVR